MILVAAAALAVLVGVVYVVLGKGGQLARFEADFPPLNLPEGRSVGSRDLSSLLIPLSMWGYHVRAVDALLIRLTAALREREERIEDLEWRLARLDPSYVPRGTGPQPGSYLPGDDSGSPAEAYAPAGGAQATSLTGNGTGTDSGADEPSPRGDDATVGGSGRDDQA